MTLFNGLQNSVPCQENQVGFVLFPFFCAKEFNNLEKKNTLVRKGEQYFALTHRWPAPRLLLCSVCTCGARLLKAAGLQPPYLQVAQVGDVSPAAHVGVYAFNVYNSHWPCVVIR